MKKVFQATVVGAASPIMDGFVLITIQTMLPWLIVMFAVILCDLIAGVRKSVKLHVHVSPSRALRETLWKMVVYFSIVVMVSAIDAATERSLSIAKWGCLLVCMIEGISIIGNMLKPNGVDFSVKDGILVFLSRIFGGTRDDFNDVVKEQQKEIIVAREQEKWGDVQANKIIKEKHENNKDTVN